MVSRLSGRHCILSGLVSILAALPATAQSVSAGGPPAPGQIRKPAIDEQVRASDEQYRFLNLGVRKDYLTAERERLIDQIRTMIPPLYEPAFSPLHGYTLPEGAVRVSLSGDRFTNNHDFGRDKYYASFFNNVKVQNQHLNLDVFYGITSDDTVRVLVPLKNTVISGTGHVFHIQMIDMSMNGTAYGLGDVELMHKHKWLDQDYAHVNFATVVGVQFPTGKNDSAFNQAQTLVMGGMPVTNTMMIPPVNVFSDDLRVPNSSQPGTGAWGASFGAMFTRQLTWNGIRGSIHGGALYKWIRDTKEGVHPGNEFTYALSYVAPPFESERFGFDLTVLGRVKQAERYPGAIMHPAGDLNGNPIVNPDMSLAMFVTPRPDFEHGSVVFVSPSLIYVPRPSTRLFLSPMYRVHEPFQGPSPAFRLQFGITVTF